MLIVSRQAEIHSHTLLHICLQNKRHRLKLSVTENVRHTVSNYLINAPLCKSVQLYLITFALLCLWLFLRRMSNI